MILFVGQYSTGKTLFIRNKLEQEFSGIRIGPEPTTDAFIAIIYADKENVCPGNALVNHPKKNFKPLAKFGTKFDYETLKMINFFNLTFCLQAIHF